MGVATAAFDAFTNAEVTMEIIQYLNITGPWIMPFAEIWIVSHTIYSAIHFS
jgi:hypothetical protein